LMQADGVHPTAAAQARMLENVWTVLGPLASNHQPGNHQPSQHQQRTAR